MEILVIGLGSMGRRRIRLLSKISPQIKMVGIDSDQERCTNVTKELGIETCNDLNKVLDKTTAQAAIISTSPLSHAKLIKQCLSADLHVFTELNLVSDCYLENMEFADKHNKILFISSTFLYRDEIIYFQKRIAEQKSKINYSYHIGQYLEDWHPWENYKNFFVSNKKTNACRELLAIELPWLTKSFGEVVSYNVIKEKSSSLDIDYPDSYHITLKHESGSIGSLIVDVISRKAVRNLEIFGEDLFLTWDGSATGIKEYDWMDKCEKTIELYDQIDRMEGYSSFIVENAYQNELSCFLYEIAGRKTAKYTFKDDITTLDLIDKIEGI